ncbi:MAG: magnesium chelatase subunit D [Steroidobacteraceae bacterium]
MNASLAPPGLWADACAAAALLAVDPRGLQGVVVRARPGPVRECWLECLDEAFGPSLPRRRVPAGVTDDRLLGGLDLPATLAAGRGVLQRGLLSEAHGGLLLLATAERASRSAIAQVCAALDTGEVILERDGLTDRHPARSTVIALDEGLDDDERVAPSLAERLAFLVDLDALSVRDLDALGPDSVTVEAAQRRLPSVTCASDHLELLCAMAVRLGIDSLRMPAFALRAARAAAALAGRAVVAEADLALAVRLVFGPRARVLEAAATEQPPPSPPESRPEESSGEEPNGDQQPLEDQVLEAIEAALPAGLLDALREGSLKARTQRAGGRGEGGQASRVRGRPAGVRAGRAERGARLDLVSTLRAAAPWQPLRRPAGVQRVYVQPEDCRITRFRQRSPTTSIFVVDASGSAALHRLAEAKGAVEMLLAECYVRRDQVALIAFRARGAELLLPPTRSLVRARRCLSALPGGGGTPLAAGLDAARELALSLARRGGRPLLVVLTDGKPNVARDGGAGRERAAADALASARALRAAGFDGLLVDTAPRPQAFSLELAAAMGVAALPLPTSGAAGLSRVVGAFAG